MTPAEISARARACCCEHTIQDGPESAYVECCICAAGAKDGDNACPMPDIEQVLSHGWWHNWAASAHHAEHITYVLDHGHDYPDPFAGNDTCPDNCRVALREAGLL